MAVSLTYNFTMTGKETLALGVPDVTTPQVNHDGYNESGSLNATSTPAVSKCSYFLLTLTAGAATIDLTSLIGANGSVTASGLKLQMIRVKNLGAATMTFATGASNGYAVWTSFSKPVYAGAIWQEFFNAGTPAVSGSVKTIDVTGTGTQTAEISLVFG